VSDREGAEGGVPDFMAFGDLGVDAVARIDHLPRADEKLWVEPGGGDFPGGMMGNAAVTVASLGITAGVVAKIGSDDRGRMVVDALRRRGVETRFVREVEGDTFWTLALTVPTGDRTLIQFPTAAFGCDWDFDRSILPRARWVHTVAEEGDPVGPFLREAHGAGPVTSLDIEYPFVLRADLAASLPFVDVAFINAAAADALGGPEAAAAQLRDQGAGTVLVTLGEAGAFLSTPGTERHVAAHAVEPVDTNGAGDAFAAAYAAGILKGLAPSEAIELAVLVAGLSTTAYGGFGRDCSTDDYRALAKRAGHDWWERL
jgi:ribokinase